MDTEAVQRQRFLSAEFSSSLINTAHFFFLGDKNDRSQASAYIEQYLPLVSSAFVLEPTETGYRLHSLHAPYRVYSFDHVETLCKLEPTDFSRYLQRFFRSENLQKIRMTFPSAIFDVPAVRRDDGHYTLLLSQTAVSISIAFEAFCNLGISYPWLATYCQRASARQRRMLYDQVREAFSQESALPST